MTAISVTLAPRARILVKASWPGVSRKVMPLLLHFLAVLLDDDIALDRPRADDLRDAAGLGGDDIGLDAVVLADLVEQRRLAVVDVAHDGDDRRPRAEFLRLDVLEQLPVALEQQVFLRLLLLGDEFDVLFDGDERGDVEVDDRVAP